MDDPIPHPPRRWALLIAVAPLSILVGALVAAYVSGAYVAGFTPPGAPELLLLWLVLNAASVPAVVLGVWLDVPRVERETGVGQRRWVWAVPAVVLAPLVGTVYLYHRRKWFAGGRHSLEEASESIE